MHAAARHPCRHTDAAQPARQPGRVKPWARDCPTCKAADGSPSGTSCCITASWMSGSESGPSRSPCKHRMVPQCERMRMPARVCMLEAACHARPVSVQLHGHHAIDRTAACCLPRISSLLARRRLQAHWAAGRVHSNGGHAALPAAHSPITKGTGGARTRHTRWTCHARRRPGPARAAGAAQRGARRQTPQAR